MGCTFTKSDISRKALANELVRELKSDIDLRRELSDILFENGGVKQQEMEAGGRQGLTPSQKLSKEDILKKFRDCRRMQQIEAISNLSVQQTINCCNVTAIAKALSAIGLETTMDEIMWETGMNLDFVVDDGMTLAEVYEATTRFLIKKGVDNIFCRCYTFDAEAARFEGFWEEAVKEGRDANTLFVLNFHSGIAHGWPKGGGGHFAIMVGVDEESEELVASDVHPVKYGRYWSAPARQVFNAMVDKDSSSQRARGLLIFCNGNPDEKGWPGLEPMNRAVSWHKPEGNFAPMKARLERFIPTRPEDIQTSLNMKSVASLTLALTAIDGPEWRLPRVMRDSKASYTHLLSTYLEEDQLCNLANAIPGVSAYCVKLDLDQMNASSLSEKLLQELSSACSESSVPLLGFDLNVAFGLEVIGKLSGEAGALTHGPKSWAAVAGIDLTGKRIVLADPHPITMCRLWWCKAENMVQAIKANGMRSFIVVQKDVGSSATSRKNVKSGTGGFKKKKERESKVGESADANELS